ncbi:hypothetical protein ISN44_As11g006750 [Arabidopsis suecica]|uniref:Uncharacterized protein n=1 Tax=Arabidopsis suecica TaxID=45249 RepID=A0A8T1Z686_ARASU|nr:hypothetical protein ISN44_As11g006750 [Arabidopsis suecica]
MEVEIFRNLLCISHHFEHIPISSPPSDAFAERESISSIKNLSQEKKIQKLVRDLRRQLLQCRNENQVELPKELETELNQLLVTSV